MGAPLSDFSNEPSENGGRINIGAYGNTAQASKSGIIRAVSGDINSDNIVNMLDFAILADNWYLQGAAIKNENADLDNNRIVDERDLLILTKFWLWSW